MNNKPVRLSLNNVYVAKMTETEVDGHPAYAYGTPFRVPGAVNLDLNQSGDPAEFYADGGLYYSDYSNNGYSGSMEFAQFPSQMLTEIWNEVEDSNHVLSENANARPAHFALLFEIEKNESNDRFVFYNCVASRPGTGIGTKERANNPQTQTCDITILPLYDGLVKNRTKEDTPASVRASWFNTVYMPSGTSAYVVEYNANGGTGRVVDGNSPYAAGSTAKVMHADGLTGPDSKTFDEWNTAADGSGVGYQPAANLTVNSNVTLYAIWE